MFNAQFSGMRPCEDYSCFKHLVPRTSNLVLIKEKPPGNWGLTLKQKPTIAHFHEPHFKCIFSTLDQKYSGDIYPKVTFISLFSDMCQYPFFKREFSVFDRCWFFLNIKDDLNQVFEVARMLFCP